MALIKISSNSKTSLVEQVVNELKSLVEHDVLRTGSRATSIRTFALQHHISAHTVAEAYERLVALGYLQSRPRSGFFVTKPHHLLDSPAHSRIIARDFDHMWQLRSYFEERPDMTNFSSGHLPASWMDSDLIKSGLKSLASKADTALTQYGDPYGYAPLRTLLQSKLLGLGIHSQPDQLLLTSGASQATDLVIRCLLQPGDKVLVDDPGYFNLFSNLHMQGAIALPVPRNTDGPDLDRLEQLAQEHRPVAMFTQSMLHAPTGSSISPGNAHRLLRLAEQYDFRIVENDAYCDMLAPQLPRIATLDQLSRVLYIGSFSKTLSSAMRVGFIAGNEKLMHELANMKMTASITSSQLDERLVFHCLTEGQYRRNLERLRYRLSISMQQSCDLLESLGYQLFCRPLGGKFVWLRHPDYDNSEEIWRLAADAGLGISPGKVFRVGMSPTPWFRINVSIGNDPALIKFLSALR
jgi:DNA-binding transcriptional MocR family regulator